MVGVIKTLVHFPFLCPEPRASARAVFQRQSDTPSWVLLEILSLSFAVCGCITVDIPSDLSLFPTGASFVVKGTAALIDVDGEPCPVWNGDNGIVYHLFQNPRVNNETFDRVTTPGVSARLEIATRSDLEVSCQVGAIVEVVDVLEIVG